MSREAHHESVVAAIEQVGELGRQVVQATEKRRELDEAAALITEKHEQTLGMVIMAVGEDSSSEAGRSAVEYLQVFKSQHEDLQAVLAGADERLQELARICDNEVTLLNNYLQGW